MTASLRIELFPADLDASVDFYVSVLGFEVAKDDRPGGGRYVWLRRDAVGLGLMERGRTESAPSASPVAVEIVLEVDDVTAERDRVVAAGAELADDLVTRPWGLTDFRLYDPDGNYWRVTHR
ncbi:VOC family protein [Demequina sp. TTPB684]|uniref:VOC family protein n=1 Tax=unclassified Demequina TaxID=2620311 RepID=UPI001CF491B5|nr:MULTISPECIES: VOC family protein [unclassified Demequina]MCB2411709.1 VOC family protein [Demequina sp. TTPB684]UPU88172.1 VOC family protein [Demequina sp. TMPB413]